jgi:hypothetical protein
MRNIFRRETMIALRARRLGHQIARAIVNPQMMPVIVPPRRSEQNQLAGYERRPQCEDAAERERLELQRIALRFRLLNVMLFALAFLLLVGMMLSLKSR